MASNIERLIDEIEDYIDGCKYQPLSNTKIIVNKEEIDELLRELRTKTPEELKRYQKVVSNQQAILNDAKKKAEELISSAEARTNEMLSQNAIMQQAYAQADEVVKNAYAQAQAILNDATVESNSIRSSTIEYVDGLLASYETLVAQTMRMTASNYESFYTQLNQYYDTVVSNRTELNPPTIDTADLPNVEMLNLEEEGQDVQGLNGIQPSADGTGQINVSSGGTGNIPQTSPMSPGSENSDIKLDLM